ncbi:MAG: DUF6036 family nucleotidyltransferase [Gemmatimonadota bacterium]
MCEVADRERIERFMAELAAAAREPARVYLVGGTTAVLLGWRPTTVDIDLLIAPESDLLLRALPILKERLHINVEVAFPAQFIPIPPGWEERSPFIRQIGPVSFYHYDLYAQALAKAERGHTRDLADVEAMLARGLIEPAKARAYFARLEPDLYRFPAVDSDTFRREVDRLFPA